MNWAKKISIIVPVAEGDASWQNLLKDLEPIRKHAEILFSATRPLTFPKKWQGLKNVQSLGSTPGRAKQMNFAAGQATREILWFLHSDSRFTSTTLSALEELIQSPLDGVHFFNLGFFDGPPMMLINSLGVWFRSHWLKLPFGDQGFILPKILFEKLGGFQEEAAYGEDHLLIWRAHELGSPVIPMKGKLLTSARKYSSRGWCRTTLQHLYLTFAQGKQELRRIVNKKKGLS